MKVGVRARHAMLNEAVCCVFSEVYRNDIPRSIHKTVSRSLLWVLQVGRAALCQGAGC